MERPVAEVAGRNSPGDRRIQGSLRKIPRPTDCRETAFSMGRLRRTPRRPRPGPDTVPGGRRSLAEGESGGRKPACRVSGSGRLGKAARSRRASGPFRSGLSIESAAVASRDSERPGRGRTQRFFGRRQILSNRRGHERNREHQTTGAVLPGACAAKTVEPRPGNRGHRAPGVANSRRQNSRRLRPRLCLAERQPTGAGQSGGGEGEARRRVSRSHGAVRGNRRIGAAVPRDGPARARFRPGRFRLPRSPKLWPARRTNPSPI